MALQADYGWDLPDLGDVADAPAAFLTLANGIAATIKDGAYTTYTPSWNSQGLQQPTNPSYRQGFYRVDHKVCTFTARLEFGASTAGGNGDLIVGLPLPASTGIRTQLVHCVLYTPSSSATWTGLGHITSATNFTSVKPFFPVNNARADTLPWASYNGAFGLAIPTPGGSQFSVQNGGAFVTHGTYFIA